MSQKPAPWYQRGSGKFAILPLLALSDKSLKLTTLRVLIAIAKHADPRTGACPADSNAPTLERLAKLTGMHPNNVSKATGSLQKSGWLRKTRQGGGRPTLFTLTMPSGCAQDDVPVWNPKAHGLACIVPIEVAGDPRLKLESLKVLMALSAHADSGAGRCIPGRRRISRLTGIHVNNVSDATRKLEEAGWLTRVHRYLSSNEYTLTVPRPTNGEGASSSTHGPEDLYLLRGHYDDISIEYLRTPPSETTHEY